MPPLFHQFDHNVGDFFLLASLGHRTLCSGGFHLRESLSGKCPCNYNSIPCKHSKTLCISHGECKCQIRVSENQQNEMDTSLIFLLTTT